MKNTFSTNSEFGKWRAFLWPIHRFELKKLVPMFLLFFFINFNYTILRDTKDSLIVTAPSSGAEAIPFLKGWGVMPMAVIFMLVYAKASNIFSKPKIFYGTISFFILFFILFALILYPYREALHPHTSIDQLQSFLPTGFGGLIAIIRNWTFSLFYVFAELWGSIAISLLFWGFANDITKVSESKRFYAIFGLGANIAMLFSGPIVIFFAKMRSQSTSGIDTWGFTLNCTLGLVVLSGLIIMGIYQWINKNILTDAQFYESSEMQKIKKEKLRLSLMESLKYLASSKYIGCLALLVLADGIAINLVDVAWKGQLKLQYPHPNDYQAFMGYFSTLTGLVTIFMLLFVGGNVIRRFGWKTGAMFTPIVLFITSLGFFFFIIFRDSLTVFVALLHTTPLMITIIFGTVQNVICKSSKYSLFDPTKEMAYIPLDQESKIKGKAVVDVVGFRLGKSAGSLIQQGLIISCGSLGAIAPYTAGILFIVVFVWILAANSLSKQFQQVTVQKADSTTSILKDEELDAL